MAPSSFSLLLRHLPRNPKFRPQFLSPLINRHFSTSSNPAPVDPPKPSSLSARLSFVFDQIDQIEKDRSEKDEALQRIRAWRESKKSRQIEAENQEAEKEELGLGLGGADVDRSSLDDSEEIAGEANSGEQKAGPLMKREVELSHPWPEWVELMERLVQQNYFDHRRKDEDQMVEGLGFDTGDVVEEGFDFTRDWKTVQTAILNFGRDRFDILRSLSRQDIQILVGYGCPSADKKVVFSAKLLRKHVHLDEGDVCSSCSLRNSCERAYLVTNKEDEARTIDVMRVLLTFGFDPISGSVANKSMLKQKSVKTVVRKLLHEVVKLSSVPIDPNLPPPVIKKRPPKVKQPPPPPKKRIGRDDIEMKKGDWLCPKCDFMNFAKNVVCLQCDAKRPKRQLLPGEWECPQCNFLNYRRNMTCFNCEHKRPPDEYIENQMAERQPKPFTKPGRAVRREEISNAWNFDFDDDESDGADVAAFEYADTPGIDIDRHLDTHAKNTNFRIPQDDMYESGSSSRVRVRDGPSPAQRKGGPGFDDFDDEEDDIESYEPDYENRNLRQESSSSVRLSDLEDYSESEGDDDLPRHARRSSTSDNKSFRPSFKGRALSDSEDGSLDSDSDIDLPVNPKWKSSQMDESRRRGRTRRAPSNGRSFGSDEGDDDREVGFRRGRSMAKNRDSNQWGSRGGDNRRSNRRQSELRNHRDVRFVRGDDSNDGFGRSSRMPRGNDKGSRGDGYGGRRMNARGNGREKFNGFGKQGGINRKRGMKEFDEWSDVDNNERPIRERINVR